MKKKQLTTVQKYYRWNVAKWVLFGTTFASPLLPVGVMTAINWDEWFAKAGSSLPLGFASLLVTTLLAVIGIWKKDDITSKLVSAIYYLAILFACLGATFLFLASLTSQVGYMFMATASGLLVSGTADQFNKMLVKPRESYLKELVLTNGLDKKQVEKEERKAREKAQAEMEAKSIQATE